MDGPTVNIPDLLVQNNQLRLPLQIPDYTSVRHVTFVTSAFVIDIHIKGKAAETACGRKTMTSESYSEKRHELQASNPVFNTFASSMGLIAAGILLIELVL